MAKADALMTGTEASHSQSGCTHHRHGSNPWPKCTRRRHGVMLYAPHARVFRGGLLMLVDEDYTVQQRMCRGVGGVVLVVVHKHLYHPTRCRGQRVCVVCVCMHVCVCVGAAWLAGGTAECSGAGRKAGMELALPDGIHVWVGRHVQRRHGRNLVAAVAVRNRGLRRSDRLHIVLE